MRRRICQLGQHRPVRRGVFIALALISSVALLDLFFPLPSFSARGYALVVVARDGTPLRAFPDRDHVWRHPVTLAEVSPLYLETLLTYEDQWFRWHPGVNPFALIRAAWQWAHSGRIVSGGSTISMQVARMLEPMSRSVPGKLRQCLRAMQLELHYSKDEILTLYLNHVPMGGVLEGVETASRAYFSKPAIRLSHAEAALLTVIPQAPSRMRPDRYPLAAKAARDKVLERMQARWGAAQVADAKVENVYALSLRAPILAPLLAERLRQQAGGRTRLDTTLDAHSQLILENLLGMRVGGLPPHVSMAALVVDNASLEVRAYAGSADFTDEARASHVDMVRALRSPGSALKPFLYAIALDEGLIHSESLLTDAPQSFAGYQPGNFQQSFTGPVSVSEALVRSLNVPAVEVLDHLEPQRFAARLRRGGLALALPDGASPNLSIILGGAAVTLEQLTGAYTALARGGMAGKPRYTLAEPLVEARMMSAGAAYIVRDILEAGGVVNRAVSSRRGGRSGIAWKTGTSFGFRDAWAAGVSDRYTVGVWVGRPDGTPNPGFFGANIAAPLLQDIFAAIDPVADSSHSPPSEVTQATICWPLGTRLSAAPPELCQVQRTAWVLNGIVPPTFPDRMRETGFRQSYKVTASGLRAEPDCTSLALHTVEGVRWPVLLEPWLAQSIRDQSTPPPWLAGCQQHEAQTQSGLRIVGANHNEVLRSPRYGEVPTLELFARGVESGEIFWLVNGQQVARSMRPHRVRLPLPHPGRYDITALATNGRFDRISISVPVLR